MAVKRYVVLDSNVFFNIQKPTEKGIKYIEWLDRKGYRPCITIITKAEFLIARGKYTSRYHLRKMMQEQERLGLRILPLSAKTGQLLTALASHEATPTIYLKHNLADALIAIIAHEHRMPILTENKADMPGWMGWRMVEAE